MTCGPSQGACSIRAALSIWLDKDDLGAGVGWQLQIENAISKKTTAFVVHIGAKGVVNWVESEVRLALSRATGTTDYPFIPILSRECAGAAAPPTQLYTQANIIAPHNQAVCEVFHTPETARGAFRDVYPKNKEVSMGEAHQDTVRLECMPIALDHETWRP